MRVALDATPLTLSSGGLTRYVRELSTALARNYPADGFLLLSDQRFPKPDPRAPNLECGHGPRNALERRWWLFGLNREMSRQTCDLFHGTNFAVPYIPLRPSVLTIHDLSPWMNPEWHHSADRIRRRTPPLIRLRIATMLITHADSVRRNVIEVFQVPPGRVVSVPLAAARMFRPVTPPVRPPYFLYAGTLEPRKNLEVVLLAWRELRRLCAVDLVLAGRRREDFRLPPQEPGLEVTGEIDDNALAALYSGALAVVYPSHYEGFGLPVLEAMQCGACVFVSSDAAVREVAGNAAVVLDSGASAWLAAMRTAAGNADWVAEWRERSLRRAQDFSWESTARLTYQVYEEARRRFDG